MTFEDTKLRNPSRKIKWLKPVTFLIIALLIYVPRLGAVLLNNFVMVELQNEWNLEKIEYVPNCLKWKRFPKSITLLKTAVLLDPEDQRSWLNLGRLYWLEGSCKNAQNSWSRSISISHTDVIARMLYSLAVFTNNESNGINTLLDSLEAEKFAIVLASDSVQRQDQKQAIFWYEQALSFAARRSTVESLVPLYKAEGVQSKVVQAWQISADFLSDTDPDYWWAVGQVAELNKDWKEGLIAYEKAGKLAKSPYYYLIKLAELQQMNDPRLAESTYWTALELRPDLIWAYLGIGHIRFNNANFNGAQAFYLEAERLAPNDINPKFYLGFFYFSQGNESASCDYFRKVMAIDPNNQPSLNYISQLKTCLP